MLKRYYSSSSSLEADCPAAPQYSVVEAAVCLHIYGRERDHHDKDGEVHDDDEDIDAIVDEWKARMSKLESATQSNVKT